MMTKNYKFSNFKNLSKIRKLWLRLKGSYQLKSIFLRLSTISLGILCITDDKLNLVNFLIFIILTGLTFYYSRRYAKQLLNEYGLSRNILLNLLGKFSWYTEIIPNKLILGGIPLENFHHSQQLSDLGVTDYLSIVEKEEFNPKFLGFPVKHQENEHWLLIECADHQTLNFQQLDQAAYWIQKKIEKGGTIYVHCKSGKGRSVMAIIAWFALFGLKEGSVSHIPTNFEKIYEFIQSKRTQIHVNENQRQVLQDYLEKLNCVKI